VKPVLQQRTVAAVLQRLHDLVIPDPLQVAMNAAADKLRVAPIISEPFTHAHIDDFLPRQFYAQLKGSIPPLEYFQSYKMDWKYDLDISQGHDEPSRFDRCPESTRQAWTGLRDSIFRDTLGPLLFAKFEQQIYSKYTWLFGEEAARSLTPSDFTMTKGRIMCRKAGYRLRPHTDSAHFAVTCLLYFSPSDDSTKTGLELYRIDREPELRHVTTYYPSAVEGIECSVARRMPLRDNLFVCFVNSHTAVHGARIRAEKTSEDFERYAYQLHLVPRREKMRKLVADLVGPARERWDNGRLLVGKRGGHFLGVEEDNY
jgi:hypothetical protein